MGESEHAGGHGSPDPVCRVTGPDGRDHAAFLALCTAAGPVSTAVEVRCDGPRWFTDALARLGYAAALAAALLAELRRSVRGAANA